MLNGHEGIDGVRELEERFALVEQRVRRLLDRNRSLEARVSELEAELALARQAARDHAEADGARKQVREKIERILHSLESIKPEEQGE